jgi:hypothetical protein
MNQAVTAHQHVLRIQSMRVIFWHPTKGVLTSHSEAIISIPTMSLACWAYNPPRSMRPVQVLYQQVQKVAEDLPSDDNKN